VIALLLIVIGTGGCVTPVGVNRVSTAEAYRLLTANAMSTGTPSVNSLQVLSRLDLLTRFDEDPEGALATLHAGLQSEGDDERLFALAELSFLHAEQRKRSWEMQGQLCKAQKGQECPTDDHRKQRAEQDKERSYYLAAAVYAYALLFPTHENRTMLDPADPRSRLTYDLYNRGLTEGLTFSSGEMKLASGSYALPFGVLAVEFVSADLSWAGYRLAHFMPTANLAIRGLRNRYRRPGIGASLAASLEDEEGKPLTLGASRIPPRIKVPTTAFLRLEEPRRGLMGGSVRGRLELHVTGQGETITVNGSEQRLEVEPTVALAYLLEGSRAYDLEIAGFLRGVVRTYLPQGEGQDGLILLQPPSRDRIPLVLVHGTASSPARWAELLNELAADPVLRRRYQAWFFAYDTGNPIAYSGGRLRQALENLVREIDPLGQAPALQQMVVIGHSQGGLLTKLTAIHSGTRFWDNISTTPFDELTMEPETRDLFRRSLFLEPLPFVKQVIFVATPQRGSYVAGLRLGQIASWLVSVPGDLTKRTFNVVTQNQDKLLTQRLEKLPTSIDNMNPSSPFIKTLASIPVADGIKAHSIIAVKGDGPISGGTDGVVAYDSAHIEGVESELVVRSGHSVQSNPKAIEEIRRILYEHLQESRGSVAK
jgi:pimeloyl-ACP methyl ester carboxylesterase